MKEMTKKTAVVAMAGIMAAGMLTGCGEKKLDGSKTVATVDGTEIPLGVVSLSVRDGQMQTEAMYRSYMGGSDFSIWDTEAEEKIRSKPSWNLRHTNREFMIRSLQM